MDKKVIRQKLIQDRLLMSNEDCAKKSHSIALKVICEVDWQNVGSISVYNSISKLNEVDTKLLLATIHNQYSLINLSVITPTKNAKIPSKLCDLIIVPVVGFDKSLHRLGMGGGFYDRYLALQPQAIKVGLAYIQSKIVEPISWEPHDVPLDLIITEAIIIRRDSQTIKNRPNPTEYT